MDHFYKEIVKFQRRCNDVTDDPKSHTGQALKVAVQRLEDDVQVRKNPRSIEDQVKRVIELLEEAGKEQVISHHHVHELVEHCEEFRKELRKM